MRVSRLLLVMIGAGCWYTGAWAQSLPQPQEVVTRACDAMGGVAAFRKAGFLRVELSSEEVTEDGQTSSTKKVLVFHSESIIPVRLEIANLQVVAGDDGSGGWAVVGGRPDSRPSTSLMVRRMVTTDVFPLLLPCSLTWPGVAVTAVAPAQVGDRPTWRLTVTLARNFFFTPQISTVWTVDVDRRSYQLVRAESPFTDLGKGVVADGMRFSWGNFVTVAGLRLPSSQMVVGLDAAGNEKTHSRRDQVRWERVEREQTAGLFENPIPPEQRPRLPVGKPVSLPQNPAPSP
ncbi:MAG: hypothetical protein NZ869_01805 [Thermoanaerobaculum sp.]|nr:hypothetical protein [Thermoanaerobaculum sp.]MDW7967334.1 hypothetical protein [Thermoanaerobaculum sp.]